MKKVVLLRGINVSGKNSLKMAELKTTLEKAGFLAVQTYIQSGNVVLSSNESDNSKLETQIETLILNTFSLNVPTLVYDAAHFEHLVNESPFLKEPDFNGAFQHYTFLGKGQAETLSVEKKIQETEEIVVSSDVVYLYLPKGYGQTKLTNTWIEQQLKRKASTRNYNTCLKLIEMAKG